MSKAGKPLARYFPDLVEALGRVKASRFVLDGEIVIPHDDSLSFDEAAPSHPSGEEPSAQARRGTSGRLSSCSTCWWTGRCASLARETLVRAAARRSKRFVAANVPKDLAIRLSPATTKMVTVKKWFRSVGGGLDGVIAKRLDVPYLTGTRDGMQKMKSMRTAEVRGGWLPLRVEGQSGRVTPARTVRRRRVAASRRLSPPTSRTTRSPLSRQGSRS